MTFPEGDILHAHILRINYAHQKLRIERNYLQERDRSYKGMVLCLILAATTLQLDVSRIVIEEVTYDRLFKDNCYIEDLRTLITRIGVTDPEIFFGHLEFVQEFLQTRYDCRLMNYFSLNIDSGYFINVRLKQTRL